MKAGFTLLELLVVLVIMALLTALVAVRLQGPYQSARLEDALQRVAFVDSQTRAHAREFSTSCQIVFQLDRGRLYSQGPGNDSARHCEFSLPGSLRIERVLTSQMELGSGTACIDISARGTAADLRPLPCDIPRYAQVATLCWSHGPRGVSERRDPCTAVIRTSAGVGD